MFLGVFVVESVGGHGGTPRLLRDVGWLNRALPPGRSIRLTGGCAHVPNPKPQRSDAHEPVDLDEPIVGDLHLRFDVMYLPADPGLSFVVYGAEAGSATHHALRLLASWTADDKSTATNEPSK